MEHSAAASPARGVRRVRSLPVRPSGLSDCRCGAETHGAVYRNRVAPGGERKCGRSGRDSGTGRRWGSKSLDGHEPPRTGPRRVSPGQGERLRLRALSESHWDSCKTPQFDLNMIPQNRRIVKWKIRRLPYMGGSGRAILPPVLPFTVCTQIPVPGHCFFLHGLYTV